MENYKCKSCGIITEDKNLCVDCYNRIINISPPEKEDSWVIEKKKEIELKRRKDFKPIQSKTEKKLLWALNKLGMNPVQQYEIGSMHVDFAFPEDDVIIEVDGMCHLQDEKRIADIKRGYMLRGHGWVVWRFKADTVWEKPFNVAYVIKKRLEDKRKEEISFVRK